MKSFPFLVTALCVETTVLLSMGRKKYAGVTLAPMVVVSVTTLTAAWQNITHNFLPLAHQADHGFQGGLNAGLTLLLMACTWVILATGIRRWVRYFCYT